MIYRLLEDVEKNKLAEVFPHYAGQDLAGVPIAGAVDGDGRVRALAVLNMVPHCEPVWIENGVALDFRRLIEVVEKAAPIEELWLFVPNDKAARMAEICGAQDTGWRVFRKEL